MNANCRVTASQVDPAVGSARSMTLPATTIRGPMRIGCTSLFTRDLGRGAKAQGLSRASGNEQRQ